KTYKNETDDALTIFADKFDDGTVRDKPSTFRLTGDAIKLNRGYVEIIDENNDDREPLFFKDIKGFGNKFKIIGPNVNVSVNDFSFIENHGLEAKSLSADFEYTKTEMKFINASLETKTSTLFANIQFSYDRENLSDFNNKVNLDAELIQAQISLIDLQKFYHEIGNDGYVNLTTKISGQLNNMTLSEFNLETDKQTIIAGKLNLKNSFNTENGFSLDADFTNLTSDYFQLKTLLPDILGKSLPTTFEKLGRFTLIGKTYINQELIDAQVTIDTEIGSTIADIALTNIQKIDDASYIGNVEVINFDMGKMVNDSLVGLVSLNTFVDGKGFAFINMDASVKGEISKFEYNNYAYSNISLNGLLKNKLFSGEVEVNDENIKLNFNGLADLSSEIYKFDFKTTVDYCDLYKMNIFKRDTISSLKGIIEINLTGNTLDNLVGSINFKNSLYTNQKDNYFFKDFSVSSSFKDNLRTITIDSPEIIEGELKGQFKFNELGKLMQNSLGSNYSNYEPYEVAPNQNLNFRLEIYNKIVEVFYPEVILSANSIISGNVDSDKNFFKLNIKSPQIIAYNSIINALNLQIDNKNPLFNTQLTIDKLKSNMYNISDLHLVNKTLNDTLYLGAEFKGGIDDTEQYSLSLYHTFNKDNKSVFGIQKSNFTFKENQWFINPENNSDNKVVYDNTTKTYTFDSFVMTSKNQRIDFEGVITDTKSKDIRLNFKDVNIGSITPAIDSLELDGLINGSFHYAQLNDQIDPSANLSISNFKINDSSQGDLKINVEGKNSVRQFDVDVSLKLENNTSFSAIGDVDLTKQKPTLDIQLDFEEFKLDAFSPLGEDVFDKIRGFAYGSVHFSGLLSNPTMEGELFLDEAGLYFPYLNVDYDFVGTSVVTLKDQMFNFEDVTLRDKKHKSIATLKGTLSHSEFKKWLLNLRINTKNLLVLDTKEEENSIYFGTAFFEGEASIIGPTDKLLIDITGKTKKDTHFVLPISYVKTAETSQLIRFVNLEERVENEILRRAFISEKLKGLSINFNLEVTKEALFEMVIDKISGSNLKGTGTGNLVIELDTKDKFNMYGDFVVDNGVYDFKYGGIISKPFKVKKGGTISWNGDPLTAEINIEAINRVSANPKVLLENISSTRKIPVDLITRFSGDLFNSDIEFDIEIPNSSSTVASELEFKLSSNKNTQFISLLVTGSFYNEIDATIDG
ncbi:MAG: translocation/assembly module TamB domain-containing protein, partial [Bacteroidetes bacterium]|nr:translocation/assembly module TamB domain-containing protein [Bacteroidota bacterium]